MNSKQVIPGSFEHVPLENGTIESRCLLCGSVATVGNSGEELAGRELLHTFQCRQESATALKTAV